MPGQTEGVLQARVEPWPPLQRGCRDTPPWLASQSVAHPMQGGGAPRYGGLMKTDDLSELGVVKLASPCRMRWNDLEGDDDVVRTCTRCDQRVYNVSALSTLEARELLIKTEGRLCVRFFTRRDGTVITAQCREGQRLALVRRVAGAIGAAVLAVSGASAARGVSDMVSDQLSRLLGSNSEALGGTPEIVDRRSAPPKAVVGLQQYVPPGNSRSR
jgi:hypothetical protein